jgi:Tol biopolymer transport system component
VAAAGGSSTPLEADPGASISHRLPHFLPDGRHLLFFSQGSKEPGVYALDLQTRKAQLLFRSESEARYVEPGYLAFLSERNLVVQRFDARTLRTIGEATPIAEGVQFSPTRATGTFSFAGTRLLVFQTGVGEASQLTWLDLDGKRVGTVGEAVRFGRDVPPFSISSDGGRIVAAIQGSEAGTDLWLIDAARGVRTRLTFGAANRSSSCPVWSPDGRQVAYSIGSHLVLKDANGTAGEQELFSNGDSVGPVSWSPDGQTLAFRTQSSQTKSWDIWVLSVADRKARPFLANRANEFIGRFSPDGHWFGYLSDESGKIELYVVPYPGPGGKWQISSGGVGGTFGLGYAWLSSSELAYRSPENKWYAVMLTPRAQALDIGPPRAILGETPTGNWADYSIAMKRFLVDVPIHEERSAPVFLVTNWAAGLQDR